MQGWISIHRQIMENEFWFAERFTKAQAWIDLLLLANHKPATIFIRGNEINLIKGELAYSQLSLAERWKWNFKTVKKFLESLIKRGMIKVSGGNVTTVITILNYQKYQEYGEQNKSINKGQTLDLTVPSTEQNGEPKENRTENRTETNNNVTNSNNVNQREHGHALSQKTIQEKKLKNSNRSWRHRKRTPTEKVYFTVEDVSRYFIRGVNELDLNELNNLADKYGQNTVIEAMYQADSKMKSTRFLTEEMLFSLQQELEFRANYMKDKHLQITKSDSSNPRFVQELGIKNESGGKKNKLTLIKDVFNEDFNTEEYAKVNAIV
jgi:hypothetical protein